MHGDEIRAGDNPIHVRYQLHTELLRARLGEERVIGQHAHPKASARFATSLPMRPMPSTPNVLALTSVPENNLRSHLPVAIDAPAGAMCRASAPNMKNVAPPSSPCLPPGVFMTTTPRSVAASTSTLSMPTPARPTTRNLGAASMTLRVTFVSSARPWPQHCDQRDQLRFLERLVEHRDFEFRARLEKGNALGRNRSQIKHVHISLTTNEHEIHTNELWLRVHWCSFVFFNHSKMERDCSKWHGAVKWREARCLAKGSEGSEGKEKQWVFSFLAFPPSPRRIMDAKAVSRCTATAVHKGRRKFDGACGKSARDESQTKGA